MCRSSAGRVIHDLLRATQPQRNKMCLLALLMYSRVVSNTTKGDVGNYTLLEGRIIGILYFKNYENWFKVL